MRTAAAYFGWILWTAEGSIDSRMESAPGGSCPRRMTRVRWWRRGGRRGWWGRRGCAVGGEGR
eukprot:scaffold21176_cov107-Isochrysis_galbana.AAC.2